ncbi:hypothetical protein E2C01_041827 [Portunus trituberculatus]|uniref:Uncharacterized protein n=1 Tax=Portunus trituberculatus TaxID=210409 RepID=A0A5B7FNJ1_PORTR|nr:hypothetical protein [Portunus trituberculatus]
MKAGLGKHTIEKRANRPQPPVSWSPWCPSSKKPAPTFHHPSLRQRVILASLRRSHTFGALGGRKEGCDKAKQERVWP